MVLNHQKPGAHNALLGRRMDFHTFIPKPNDHNGRPAKRLKTEPAANDGTEVLRSNAASPCKSSSTVRDREIPDSEAGSDDEEFLQKPAPAHATDLESTLPPIKSDEEAIEEYEAFKASQDAEPDLSSAAGRLSQRKWTRGKNSIYVDAFNLALDTVRKDEAHLFDDAEMAVFEEWRNLTYEAQYLYVRLFLRKTSAWHRISGLGYHSDIADLGAAIDNLQLCRSLPISTTNPQTNPGELTPPEGTTLGDTFAFADRSEDGITTLEEASSLLKLDELKALAKEAKFQGKNKSELLKSLRRTSQKQTGLKWSSLRRSDTASSTASNGSITNEDSREETPLREDCQEENRETHFLQKIMAETGPCIRLSLPTLKLFERVHLVFYRSTEWTEKSLTTIILAQISRRNFPEYIVSRSSNIFASREILLEFEAALRTQFRVDSILEFGGKPTAEGYQSILNIFREVLPRWRVLLREEQRKEDSVYLSGEGAYLRRLSPAWVYTRIVHKASLVLGKQKEHLQEHAVLCELLEQRLFHPARRGAWYQRRALLEEHYIRALNPFDGRSEEAQKRHWKRIALCTCEEGLQDKLVHLCYHYDLQKRVGKLERALRVPKRQQHSFAHVQLAAPIEVTVTGIRLERKRQPSRRPSASDQQPASHRGERTIWLDPACDTHTECTVEEMVLSHCRGQGWKGFHSEGGIMRTLFALLFYDVLFAYVPHVFQTAFQTCPLDLHSDGFFPARAAAIEHRLVAISNGEAGGILAAVWDAHAERETCVVGLDWSFAREDLVEIVDCFAGAALAAVCRVMAQDYGQRGGGVPDLFLWRTDQGLVKFVEVKSENDRLSDTQRLWVHVLTGAGVAVELCNAVAKEVRVMD